MDVAELLKEAAKLPAADRAALADSLLESLDTEIDEDAEAAWRAEIHRRSQEINAGAVTLVPWEDAQRVCGPSQEMTSRAVWFHPAAVEEAEAAAEWYRIRSVQAAARFLSELDRTIESRRARSSLRAGSRIREQPC